MAMFDSDSGIRLERGEDSGGNPEYHFTSDGGITTKILTPPELAELAAVIVAELLNNPEGIEILVDGARRRARNLR